MTTLEETKQELDQLTQARADLEQQLDQAIENADGDAVINLRKFLSENSVKKFARKSQLIRLEKQLTELDSSEAKATREQLVRRYEAAARQVELAQKHLQEVWETWQQIGVQIFALESRIETNRENSIEKQKMLIDRTIRFKEQVFNQLADEDACDY